MRSLIITVVLLSIQAVAQSNLPLLGAGAAAGVATPSPAMVRWTMLSDTKAVNALGTTVNRCPNQAFCFDLARPTLAGNAIVSCVKYTNTPASTPAWSDDKSNTWTVIATANDTTNTTKIGCARVLNAVTGTYAITVSFAAAVVNVSGAGFEFNNVATSSADDGSATGTSASGSSTVATSTNLAPGTAGDLIVQCGIRSQTPKTTSFTVGSQSNITWKFIGTDLLDGLACQYGIKTDTASFNPQFTMGTNSGYATVAIALKAASAGTARGAGNAVVGIQHEDVTDTIGNTSPIPLQFPCEGNLLVGSMGFGMASGTTWKATGVTDGNSNTWAATGALLGNQTTGQSQMYYAQNATCTNGMTVSVATTGTGDTTKDATILLYDIQNALASNVFRQEAAVSNHATGTGPSITLFDALAPGYTAGIAIYNLQEAQNTSQSLSAPGTFWDGQLFGGEGISGGHPPDENNGWGSYDFATSAQQTWTTGFANSTSVGGYSWRVAFFGASGATKTALASETCTRTNVSPLSLTVWNAGPSYTGFKVVSNQCVPSALGNDDGAMFTAVGTLTDQIAQATIATITGGSAGVDKGIGLLLRGSIAAHTEYRFLASNATGVNTWIEKFVAGTNTVILSCTASPAWAAADVMYVSAVSTTLTIKRGGSSGTTICTTTDSAIASGYPGMDYSSTMTGSALTNWQGGAPGDF